MDDLSQFDLVEIMTERGQDRSRSRVERAISRGEGSATPAGRKLTGAYVDTLSAAIRDKIGVALSGKPGRHATAALLLDGLDTDVLAFLTLRAVVNHIIGPGLDAPLNSVAREIGSTIDDERLVKRLEASNPSLAKAIVKNAKKRGTTPSRVPRGLRRAEKHVDPTGALSAWTRDQQMHVGVYLVETMIETCPNVVDAPMETVRSGGRSRTTRYLRASANFREWTSAANEQAFRPDYLPMIQPPLPWSSPTDGGYPTDLGRRPPLVKPRPQSPRHTRLSLEAASKGDLTAVYSAVNAIQATPWRINMRVQKVLEGWEDWSTDVATALKLPARHDSPLEAMSPYLETLATDHQSRVEWRRARRDQHMLNVKAHAARAQFARELSLAREFSVHPRITSRHLDFRAVSIRLHDLPQGAPHVERFGVRGRKALGPHGGRWLAIHGANVYGVDKVPFEARVAWAEEHTQEALDVAADPFGNAFGFWRDSDCPIMTLAWCFEWAGYKRDAEAFVSRLPIALDGSCNGLQHFAAMTCDEKIGRAVNLTPSDTPNDLYADVAKAAAERLGRLSHWSCDMWRALGVSRKITKPAVLSLPYGGTAHGCLERVETEAEIWLDEYAALHPRDPHPFGVDADRGDACRALAQSVWSAMSDTMPAALTAMQIIAACARLSANKGRPFVWKTPTGFPVVQAEYNTRKRQVRTRFLGSVYKPVDNVETDRLDIRAQATSAPANFVQSLDAAALVMTVNRSTAAGVSAFAMVHDSYATYAADTDALARELRSAFVELYTNHDPLGDLGAAYSPALTAGVNGGVISGQWGGSEK